MRLLGSASTTPDPSALPTQGTTTPTHRVQDKNARSRSPSDPKDLHGARGQMDMDRDDAHKWKRWSASSSSQGSKYARGRDGTKVRDESGPCTGEDRHQYNGNRTDDGRAIRRSHVSEGSDALPPPPARPKPEDTQLSVADHGRQAAPVSRRDVDHTLRQQHEEQTELSAARYERRQRQKADDYIVPRRDYDALRADYNNLHAQYRSLKATLEQRTSELQGVQAFLTTADKFSCTEVIDTLRNLNDGVQQNTAYMAEWAVEAFNFVFQTSPTANQTPPQTTKQTRTSTVLGTTLTQLLRTKKHGESPILVELALRTYLIYELHRLASLWDLGQENQSYDEYIKSIYQGIRGAEGQAISGNWRALTRARTLPAHDKDPRLTQAFLTTIDTIISGLSDILLAAGCITPESVITFTLRSKFAEQIRHFVSLAGQVNEMIGVGVISQDLEVLLVSPDTVFDSRVMEDSFDDGAGTQGTRGQVEAVLCATDLGLMTVGAGRGQTSNSIVLKPKVVLASTVIDIVAD